MNCKPFNVTHSKLQHGNFLSERKKKSMIVETLCKSELLKGKKKTFYNYSMSYQITFCC